MQLSHIKTVILAGGRGMRLASLTGQVPKPMVGLEGKPLLFHILKHSQRYGFHIFLFKTGYMSDQIESYFRDGKGFNCEIKYLVETQPLGTAGGLSFLEREPDPVLVLYGDVVTNVNLRRLVEFHRARQAQATLLIHRSDHPEDSDVVVVDKNYRIQKIIHKPGNKNYGNITNAALYILNPECFSSIPDMPFDFAKDLFPRLLEAGFNILGYHTDEYIKDVGTTKRLEEVENDVEEGKVFNRIEAVFLDRDGTVNEEVNLLHQVKDFRLIPGTAKAIKRLNDMHIPVVIVTNQPVVARNLCDEEDVRRIHKFMTDLLANNWGAYVDDVLYCPHHPERHHMDGNPIYRIDCDCRKPKPGMLLEIQQRLNLDLANCFIIGDTTADILTGENAGCRTALVKTGYGGEDKKYDVAPDYVFENLLDAVRFLEKYNKTTFKRIIVDIRNLLVKEKLVVVIIGGCSKTGKSTLAIRIAETLPEASPVVLSLDSWLLEYERRPDDSRVYQRFDYVRIEEALGNLFKGEEIKAPLYDPKSRKIVGDRSVRLLSSKLLIVEGVVALDIPKIRAVADITIFKDERDTIRKARVLQSFAQRDIPEEQKPREISERELEEVPYIKETARYASYVL